jgi:hypothetical protein
MLDTSDLGEQFVECSSAAFSLASPLVNPGLIRPRPLPPAQNESTGFCESLRSSRAAHRRSSKTGSGAYGRGTANRKWMSRNVFLLSLARPKNCIKNSVGYVLNLLLPRSLGFPGLISHPSMSAFGHKRRAFCDLCPMSALCQKRTDALQQNGRLIRSPRRR